MNRTQFRGVAMSNIVSVLFALGLVGCHERHFDIGKTPLDVENSIRTYYAKKYPAFAELVALSNNKNASLESINRGDKLRQICPVEEISNSSPHGPFCTFIERTEKSKTHVSVTRVNLYANGTKTCRIVICVGTQEKQEGAGYSTLRPITENEIQNMANAASKLPAVEDQPGK